MTLKLRILRSLTRLLIILVSLTRSLFSEKMLIFNRSISGLKSNLIKKSWTDSTVTLKGLELVSRELNHGHFACLCWGFEFYEVKKKEILLLFFKKKMEILLFFFIAKSLQKEQNSTNLLL